MKAQGVQVRLAPQNILVVDDEAEVRELLVEALSTMGYDVQAATDGLDAIERLQDHPFNIVITDMNMPRLDGMDLIRFLTKHRSDIDIIAITGYVMNYSKTEVIKAGANDYITKPFTLDDIEATLTRLIRDQKLVRTDALTHLYNRRYFWEIIRQEAVRAVRYQYPLCLFFIDIDYFGDYNNQKGHAAGDELLKKLAEILQASVREYVDGAFRWGGDEFVILLPHLAKGNALAVANRIRKNYNRLNLKPTSLSIGIAQFRQDKGNTDDDINDMILRADNALLLKHRYGRNKIFFSDDSASEDSPEQD
jgi:diguanylate cyclase (GGDEF)-like protein